MTKQKKPEQMFTPGTDVILCNQYERSKKNREVGRVIYCYWNGFLGCWDYYVAFFGNNIPRGRFKQKPYVLRYLETSLKRYKP